MHIRLEFRLSLAIALLAFVSCDQARYGALLVPHQSGEPSGEPSASDIIEGIERLSPEGPYVSGTEERFRVSAAQPLRALRWEASGGDLVAEGAEARWVLPEGEQAWLRVTATSEEGTATSAEYRFGLLAVGPTAAPQGPVDPTNDTTDDICRLSFNATNQPRIGYLNSTHQSLWYAEWDGTTWKTSRVDGAGFGVGGIVGFQFDMVLDAVGEPHFVYFRDTDIYYATRSSGVWTREKVDVSVSGETNPPIYGVGIDLDPSQGGRPTIVYSNKSLGAPVVAHKDGVGGWTNSAMSASTWLRFSGGFAFDASGTAWITYDDYPTLVNTWSAAGGWGTAVQYSTHSVKHTQVAFDSSGEPLILQSRGLMQRLGSGAWISHTIEAGGQAMYSLATHQGTPHILLLHPGTTTLEMVTPDADGYFEFTAIGSISSSTAVHNWGLSLAIDSAGTPHACFGKSGTVNYY